MFVNNGDEGMIMVLTSLLLYIYIVYTNVLTVDSNFCFFCVMCIFMCAHLSQRQYGPIYDDIFRKVLLKHQHRPNDIVVFGHRHSIGLYSIYTALGELINIKDKNRDRSRKQ